MIVLLGMLPFHASISFHFYELPWTKNKLDVDFNCWSGCRHENFNWPLNLLAACKAFKDPFSEWAGDVFVLFSSPLIHAVKVNKMTQQLRHNLYTFGCWYLFVCIIFVVNWSVNRFCELDFVQKKGFSRFMELPQAQFLPEQSRFLKSCPDFLSEFLYF